MTAYAVAYWIPALAGIDSQVGEHAALRPGTIDPYFSVAVSASENSSSVRSSRSGVTET